MDRQLVVANHKIMIVLLFFLHATITYGAKYYVPETSSELPRYSGSSEDPTQLTTPVLYDRDGTSSAEGRRDLSSQQHSSLESEPVDTYKISRDADYTIGETRYLWIPDGNGNDQFVDLKKKDHSKRFRGGERNSYLLCTRSRPTRCDLLQQGHEKRLNFSDYDGRRPLVVLVHGWKAYGYCDFSTTVRNAVLNFTDANVLILDWHLDASMDYSSSAERVTNVGKELARFINWIFKVRGGSWGKTHLIGYDLGAHLVGSTGRYVRGAVKRITALDAAGPSFYYYHVKLLLTKNDAQYVEAIHTDYMKLGIDKTLGHVDFWPNGGKNQPGCKNDHTCSHVRSYQFFAASLKHKLKFIGQQCDSVAEAKKKACTGACYPMGNLDWDKKGSGIYFIKTSDTWPYYVQNCD